MALAPFLLPAGGVSLPSGSSFSQSTRPAVTHRLLVQTPLVYPNAPTVRLVVQCYDRFGNAHVAPRAGEQHWLVDQRHVIAHSQHDCGGAAVTCRVATSSTLSVEAS